MCQWSFEHGIESKAVKPRVFASVVLLTVAAVFPVFQATSPVSAMGVAGGTTDTPTTISMAWVFDQHVPIDQVQADEAAQNVGFVWGAIAPETAGGTAAHYFYLSWQQGFCPNNGLSLSCPSGAPPSLPWLRAHHPDWILWQANAKGRPTVPARSPSDPGPIVDFTNPAVQKYWVDNLIRPALRAGYAGVSWDHSIPYNAYRAVGHYNTKRQFVRLYNGDTEQPAYAAAQASAVSRMLLMAQAIRPSAQFASSVSNACDYPHQSDWFEALQHVQIVFDEAGYTNWGDSKYPWVTASSAASCRNQWLERTEAYIKLQKEGKSLILDNEIPMALSPDETKTNMQVRALMQWSLANYLLVKYSHTYFWFGTLQRYGYPLVLQPEELVDLGTPVGDMRAEENVYVRRYSKGMAVVNPSAHRSLTITLPKAKYETLYGRVIDSATLAPHSGLILTLKG